MTEETEKAAVQNKKEACKRERGLAERVFEEFLWGSRFLVLFAVVSSLFAALTLFVIGSFDTLDVLQKTWAYYVNHDHSIDVHNDLVGDIIGAVDIYLIAVVLLIFSFGLYELFISEIDPAKQTKDDTVSNILQIRSLDSLKDKIAQVIVMALIVKYFQMVLQTEFHSALEMIYLAVSILALALAVYFLNRIKK